MGCFLQDTLEKMVSGFLLCMKGAAAASNSGNNRNPLHWMHAVCATPS